MNRLKQKFNNIFRHIPGAWIDAGVAHIVRLICLLFTYKIVALYFGSEGVGAFGWVQSGIMLLFGLQTEGITRYLNARIAGRTLEVPEVKTVLGTAAIASIPGIVMAFCALYWWAPAMPFFSESSSNFWLIAAGFLLLVALYHHLLGIVLAGPDPQLYLTALPATAIWQCLILTGVATFTNDLGCTLLAIPSGQIFTLIILQPYSTLKNHRFEFKIGEYKDVGRFLWMAIVLLVCGRFTEYLSVQWAIKNSGLGLTGLWQAGVKVSDALLAPFNVVLTTVLLPQISKLIADRAQLRPQLKQWLKISLGGYAIVIAVFFALAPFVLEWLYSYEFVAGSRLMRLTLVTDLLRVPAFLLATVLVSSRATRLFTIFEVSSALFYILLLFLMQDRFAGLNAWVYAHFIRYIFYLIALIWACRTYLWKPLG